MVTYLSLEDRCRGNRLHFSNICGYVVQHEFCSSVLGVHADNVFFCNGNSDHGPPKSKQFGLENLTPGLPLALSRSSGKHS